MGDATLERVRAAAPVDSDAGQRTVRRLAV
jgi:hypothetical protein